LARVCTGPDVSASVALVRGGALGDYVLTLPLIRALRAAVPEARLILVGDPATTRLAGDAERIDPDDRHWSQLYTSAGAPQTLRERFSDCRLLVACVAGGSDAAPPGYLENLSALCPRLLVGDPLPTPGQQRHMSARLLDPLREAGFSLPDDSVPRIELPQSAPGEELVILHPGSGSRDKCWPAERFVSLLAWLEGQGQRVGILWGPVEEARRFEFPQALAATSKRLCPESPLDLAGHLAAARLYVGNDSGPGHVAAAVGCPTLSLFGPTDPRLWRPLGPRAHVLRAPCGQLEDLATTAVIQSVAEVLAE